MSVITCPGMQFSAEISRSSAYSHQVHFLHCCVSIFLTHVLSVLIPFTSPLYHIHDEDIHFLNNIILHARNGSEAVNVKDVNVNEAHSSSHAKHRPYMPYDYQGSSSCTLEDAAASLCSSEPDHREMFLLQDILLKKKITSVYASVFTNEISQLQSILMLHGLSYVVMGRGQLAGWRV